MSRVVRIATVSLELPPGPQTVSQNLDRAAAAVNAAGSHHPDIVCLPEMYPALGAADYPAAAREAASPAAGVSQRMAAAARRWHCYLLSPSAEEADGRLYNTTSVFDRSGHAIGAYRKTHLAPGEEELFTPGDDYPVIETDFGRIGIMTCMDVHYPEIARIYALQGVDILFWPTMAYGPTGEFLEVLFRSRAMDNQIYCVTSNFCQQPYLAGKPMGRAYVVGPDGKIRADTGHRPGIAVVDLDLDEGYEYWVARRDLPTLKEAFLGLRRPDTYGVLVRSNELLTAWRIGTPKLSSTWREMMRARDASRVAEPLDGRVRP